MDMRDKELDGLFRSKLDRFEVEPSANVWAGVDAGLSAGKRRKTMMAWLSIAAGIIVLATAGLLFIAKKPVTKTDQQTQSGIAKTSKPVKNVPAVMDHQPDGKKLNNPVKVKDIQAIAKVQNAAKSILVTTNKADTIPGNLTQPIIASQQVIAVGQQKQPPVITRVVPDNGTPLTIKQPGDQPLGITDKPMLSAAQLPAVSAKDSTPVKARHRVHSFGGLLNLMIAKVDKRKDKVIEFGNNEDDESNITGANLGIIKIKKGE